MSMHRDEGVEQFDVVVVGAGPGGSVAARYAAEAGLSVLVLERGARPGDKNVSGTGLSPKCWRDLPFMKELALPNMRLADQATVHLVDRNNRELFNLTFSVSDGAAYEEARRFLTMNVYRSEFDPWLAGLATAAGAQVRCGVCVRSVLLGAGGAAQGVVLDDGTRIAAKLVMGADGVVSAVARTAGLRQRWARDECAMIVQYDYGAEREDIDRVIGGNALHYWYGATFPVGYTFFAAHGFHAGLGTSMGAWEKGPHTWLDRFFAVEGVRRQIELTRGERREFQAHMAPMVAAPGRTHGAGVLLIGDAAGFACPLEAEGVYYAMLSGKLAAETAIAAARRRDFSTAGLASYEQRWKASPIGEEFEAGPEFARFVKQIGFNPAAGEWIAPLVNDVAFSLFNVADAHTTNFRSLEQRLGPHLPALNQALRDVLLPLALAVGRPESSRTRRPMLELLARALLPRAARLLRRRGHAALAELQPFVLRHFAAPYLEASVPTQRGAP